jgi:hypothetical protein
MKPKQVWKLFLAFTFIHGMVFNAFAQTIDNPCGGASALIDIIDRPTVADSACVVPFKKALLELGYQYQQLHLSSAHQHNLPEAEFRIGLPANNEFSILLPNYIYQSVSPHSGYTATTIGLKHEIGYTKHWLGAVEGLFTLPGGSAAFGSKGLGATFNGIISYTFNPQFNITLMLGVSTETQSRDDGGRRFTSFNPDVVFTYTANTSLDFYAEIYGQSKTAPGQRWGLNFDSGFIHLLSSSFAIDLEVGQRIYGSLGGFDHYFGAGMGIMF